MSGGDKMRKVLCALFGLALRAGDLLRPCGANRRSPAGTVQGDVADEKGGSVAGATVEAKKPGDQFSCRRTPPTRTATLAFLSLAPGRYTLTISKPGFRHDRSGKCEPHRRPRPSRCLLTMKVSSVAQQIVVSDVPIVEVTKTESSSTLNETYGELHACTRSQV